ncbi:SE-cephalotoxin-like [Myxocyprinus asiaticus]|uniref:SE-cephalotoxin-like n=1 Tax=Myxocyprinus asiaticus TaxID=70543 RepID=UPI002222CB18|nr:SE-cephalotoxin-like [Myxocyprinus asiaticus]XP_051525525.1 SE-cephalotoxin-like [Myxocyprinus asiaticus]
MTTVKTFITILYLILYSSFCTADITTLQINQVEKGIAFSKELLKGFDDVTKWVSEPKELKDTIQKVFKVFDIFGKVAASFGFIGALISFIFAFIPKLDPVKELLKEQFAEVNRKLDSLSIQISTLKTHTEWTDYASSYGKDENVIKNSWAKLREFIDQASAAPTQEQKSRLAERFTTFYENTGTENSIANLYRYITENNSVSLNKNLLKLIIEKSNGDFNALVQYSTYFTGLMVSGLKLNVFYYIMKGYDAEAKAKEAVTQLSDTLSAIKDAFIECVDGFEKWAKKDAETLSTEKFSDIKMLASDIKAHLERKFHWYKWMVIVHSKEAKNEFTFGQSISFVAQEKTVVHLIHQEKGTTADQKVKDNIKSSMQTAILELFTNQKCLTVKEEMLHKIGAEVISHIQFLHAVAKQSDYGQTDVSDVELKCQSLSILNKDRYFNVFLKSKNIVEKPPCSKVNCNHGECKPIKDTTQGFCKCHKMFHGPACEEKIQDMIDYATIEGQINNLIYQPVPDLTAIYFSVKELKDFTKEIIESVRHDIHWTQIFVKYSNVVEKFRYINTLHTLLENSTITKQNYVSEVGAQFTGGHTFKFFLTSYNHMMMGTGFGDKHNILDVFRKSLVQDSQTQPGEPVECTKGYRDQIDYFVRYMFTLEKEAVLAWFKYILISGKSEDIDFEEKFFRHFVSHQWRLFNKNGCGVLKAVDLQNIHCEKPYHSTHQQQVKLKCRGDYKPFPETVLCSGGQWSALPVCYTEKVKGRVQCSSENGSTICKAPCPSGWTSQPLLSNYRCSKSPCPSFTPKQCDKCTDNSVCKDEEVCTSGTCRDACLVSPCGVNAKCSSTSHRRSCTCVSPWKGDAYQGCRSQDLQWILTRDVPYNAVRSKTNLAVCKAIGPNGAWHSGFVQNKYCKYEYAWKEYLAGSYKVLVDPCQGRGWKWMEGAQSNMFEYEETKRYNYVCSGKSTGLAGKLFSTRHGYLCHVPKYGKTRDGNFYSLVQQPCI